jgi:predicted regulator of Ras-like GTPase activity (Roadblock/LC7/MglB family)
MSEDDQPSKNNEDQGFDWDGVVNQVFDMIGTDTAIIDRYGLILASRIQGFEKGKLLSPLVWDLIRKRSQLSEELEVKQVSSLALETDKGNIIVSFGTNICLLSVVPVTVDLAQLMPSISRFISTLDKSTDTSLNVDIQKLDFEQEFNELLNSSNAEKTENFPIFKDLIKIMTQK